MKTFNDLQALGQNEAARAAFIRDAVNGFRGSTEYREAATAEAYFAKKNVTISSFQKFLYTVTGRKVTDSFSSNFKIKSLIFPRLVTQQAQYILGNGTSLLDMENKKKLGKDFDFQLQKLAMRALVDGVAYGFWNYDHLEVFGLADTATEPAFCPLYSEETAQLMAGIRFWYRNIGDDRIFRATLYEADGITEYYAKNEDSVQILKEKTAYKTTIVRTWAGGVEEVTEENYGVLPIVPLYANMQHQSELVGLREAIDCYDLVKSGFANDIDTAQEIFWVVSNSGGMDDVDLAKFMQRLKTTKAVGVDADEGGEVQPITAEVPVTARETLLDRLERDIYKDAQALDVSSLSAAQKTAQEIQAAYQPMDNKSALFEYFILEFMDHILALADLPDEEASFRWNKITNQSEVTNMILMAANYLSPEAVISHLPFLTPEEAADEIQNYNQSAQQPFIDEGGEINAEEGQTAEV